MTGIADRFQRVRDRDRHFIATLNLEFLDKVLLPLFVAYLCLDFLDVYSTLLAMRELLFQELNPIASTLFSLKFEGFLIAIVFKYLPAIPLFYLVFVKDPHNLHPFQIRLVRFIALVALVAADSLLTYIVAINNIPTLLAYL